jgi:CubicO group peptidase (beta-lactamase class C family)
MAPDTLCYLGSISKQFTAAALILAALDGALDLDDRLRRWLPELPDHVGDVRLDHLLHHTAGFRDYFNHLAFENREPGADYTPTQLLADLGRQDRMNHAPGDRFIYSNTHFVLLGLALERATGCSLSDFAAERIFSPLGMERSCFLAGERPTGPGVATAYDPTDDGWKVNDPVLGVVGDGGVRSTILDLFEWHRCWSEARLARDLIAMLRVPGELSDGRPLTYARGVGRRVRRGRVTWQHGGGLGAWRSMFITVPAEQLSVAVLANAGDVAPLSIATAVLDAALDIDEQDPPYSPSRVPPAFLGHWVDPYYSQSIEIREDGSGGTVVRAFGSAVPARADPVDRNALVAPSLGLRFRLRAPRLLEAEIGGDPWTEFDPVAPSARLDTLALEGEYRCSELLTPWSISAVDNGLHVSPLDWSFEPTAARVFGAGYSTMAFDDGVPSGFRLSSSRAVGFRFEPA